MKKTAVQVPDMSLHVFSEEVKVKALKEVEILKYACDSRLQIPIINLHFQNIKVTKCCNTHGGLHEKHRYTDYTICTRFFLHSLQVCFKQE